MTAPVPKHKWSWQFDRCVRCKTTGKKGKHRHKGRGLCLACYDRKRGRNPKRKAAKLESLRKFRRENKHKKWFKEKNNEKARAWRTTRAYQLVLRKRYIALKYRRLIKNLFTGTGRKLKRNEGITIRHNGLLIQTPLKNVDIYNLTIFRKELDRYFDLKV